jgi:hypothetical protein
MSHARGELKQMTMNIDLRCTVEGHVLHIDKNTLKQNDDGMGFWCMAIDRSNGALYNLNIRVMANVTTADLYSEKESGGLKSRSVSTSEIAENHNVLSARAYLNPDKKKQ